MAVEIAKVECVEVGTDRKSTRLNSSHLRIWDGLVFL